MRSNLRLAAIALALVFAGATTAQSFVLEKAAGAKWRADIVKRQNAFTACVLKAWNACEGAAGKAFIKGTCGTCTGASLDCNTVTGATTSGDTKFVPALAKCDLILDGLSKQNTKAPQLRLRDIGCLGDCDVTGNNGPQACSGATPDAEMVNMINAAKTPAANIRSTILAIGGGVGPILCETATAATPQDATVQANLLISAVTKYIPAVGNCVAKCQEDIGTKAGGGFRNDGAACLLNTLGTGAAVGPGPLNDCVSKAHAGSMGKLAAGTCVFQTPSLVLGGLTGEQFLMPLLTGQVNSATNSNYDRVDYQALFAGVTPPGQHTAFADRSPGAVPAEGWQRYAFGTCASCGNGVLEDYEECDSGAGNNSLCGTPAVPGSVAGACPTLDNPTAGVAACRCPRS